VSENPKYADDADVSRRVQSIRLEILTLTETFQLPELENKTHRLYAQDSQMPLSKRETDSLSAARAENATFSAKCWVLFQSFISAVADLVVSITYSPTITLLLTHTHYNGSTQLGRTSRGTSGRAA